MITERKLNSLSDSTRLRKIRRLLYAVEISLRSGGEYHPSHTNMLIRLAGESLGERFVDRVDSLEREASIREINRVRHAIRRRLGEDPADWDLLPPWSPANDEASEPTAETAEFFSRWDTSRRVYLDDIRSPFNVGAIFRTCAAFGFGEIILSTDTASPEHPRAQRSAMGATDLVPWRYGSLAELTSGECFALETGGTPIDEFCFPNMGTVLVGNEELGISPDARRTACQGAGICTIPLAGAKASLNVAAACAILLDRWREVSNA